MGLDLGIERAGFVIRLRADNMPAAIETARINRPHSSFFDSDIRALTGQLVQDLTGTASGELDLLAGGPPCQSFSTAGRRLGIDDRERGPLVFDFIRLVGELKPRAFMMENVKGLLSASIRWRQLPYNNNGKVIDGLHGSLFREIRNRLQALGYSLGVSELNAADYGVPQVRRRVFIIGYRDSTPVTFPAPSHAREPSPLQQLWRTIGDVLADPIKDHSHCAKFSERKLRYLEMIPPGGNWRALPEELQRESMGKAFYAKGGRSGYWRRLSLEAPSPTILTEPQNASTALCHPLEDRPLSVRECARIQTFPDEWVFAGSGSDQYKLVGNAVPVLLSAALATHIKEALIASRVSVDALTSA